MEIPKVQFLKAARYYANKNLKVIPVCETSKKPLIAQWPERASFNEKTLQAWSDRWPNANIGLLTDSFLIIDFDARGGKSLTDLITEHEEEFGKIPKTWMSKTPNGLHVFYKKPGVQRVPSQVGFRKNVDIRSDGGFGIVAPSSYAHGVYAWEYGHGIHEVPLAPIPASLRVALTGQEKISVSKTTGHWSNLIREGIVEGRRNQSIAELSGYLIRCVGQTIASDLVLAVNRTFGKPPLTDDEVYRTVESIRNRENRGGSM